MKDYGFFRVAAAVPVVKVADTDVNAERICTMISEASSREVSLVVFPELCVTGYTCGDLFGQQLLLENAEKAVRRIMEHTRGKAITAVIGAPVRFSGRLPFPARCAGNCLQPFSHFRLNRLRSRSTKKRLRSLRFSKSCPFSRALRKR